MPSLRAVAVSRTCNPVGLAVYNVDTRALMRVVGVPGGGSVVGNQAQIGFPRWISAAPWSTNTVLVPDSLNSRVIEVDVVTGVLVKVWLTGSVNVFGVAATGTRLAVSYGSMTGTARLDMYIISGGPPGSLAFLWSVGGAELGAGITTGAGVLLGAPAAIRFSQDATYVAVVETNSNRVTKWGSAKGVYLGSVGTGYSSPLDVLECWTGSGVGTLVADSANNRVVRVSEAGAVTASSAALLALAQVVGVSLVPGKGVVVVGQSQGLYFLSSVTVATHPASATAVTPSTATFTVALTANSATSGLTYAWTKAGVPVGTSSPSYTYTATAADVDAGPTYAIVCTITHATGYAVTNAATLTVVRGVTIGPLTALATVGEATVTFTATPAAGNTVSVYAWTLGGVAVGTSTSSYTYTAVDSDGGSVRTVLCTVTAVKGVAVSNVATLTVQVGGP